MTDFTKNPTAYKLRYERTECSRCGGSGRYSWNAVDGDRCWGCRGSGQQLTKQARKALEAIRDLREQLCSTEAANLKVGDTFRLGRNSTSRRWMTVYGIDECNVTIDGEKQVRPVFMISKPGQGNRSFSTAPNTKVELAPTDEQWLQILQLADSLPGVEVVAREEAK